MQNPFTNPAFSMTALTNAMNILPINYGRVENLNLFPSRSVIPIPITGQTDGQRWKKSHNEVSKIARYKWH